MSKPILRSISETINSCPDFDDECIKAIVAMDSKIYKAIKDYKDRKNNISHENTQSTIVTGDDIREAMMRPMIKNEELSEESYMSEEEK